MIFQQKKKIEIIIDVKINRIVKFLKAELNEMLEKISILAFYQTIL